MEEKEILTSRVEGRNGENKQRRGGKEDTGKGRKRKILE